jgi:hypothetical protein
VDTEQPPNRNIAAVFSLSLCLPPIAYRYIWIYIFNVNGIHEDSTASLLHSLLSNMIFIIYTYIYSFIDDI